MGEYQTHVKRGCMIDFNSSGAFADRVNWLIDAGMEETPREPRRYLGCSVLGGECERAAQYEALAAKGEVERPPETARLLRIFQRGHEAENWCAAWIRQAGFVLLTEDPRGGGQFEVSFLNGFLRGHADGILAHYIPPPGNAWQSPIELPALWENKCLGAKGWRALQRANVRKVYPKYFAQVQLYMLGLNLRQCLFTALNADTMELHHERIEYSETAALDLLARARRIKTACDYGEMLPHGPASETNLTCRLCHWSTICWE